MNTLFFSLIILLGPTAFAKKAVTCYIENPCAWLKADPHYPDEVLGYCVRNIIGNEATLVLQRVNGQGQTLTPLELTVETVSKESLVAVSADGKIDLKVDKYSDYLAGGLVIRTKKSPGGLGFFVSCRIE